MAVTLQKKEKRKKIKAASSDGRALAPVARRGLRQPCCIFCSSASADVHLLRCFVKGHFLLPGGGAMTVGECRHVDLFRAGLLSNVLNFVQIWAFTAKLLQLPVSWRIIDATDTPIDENAQIAQLYIVNAFRRCTTEISYISVKQAAGAASLKFTSCCQQDCASASSRPRQLLCIPGLSVLTVVSASLHVCSIAGSPELLIGEASLLFTGSRQNPLTMMGSAEETDLHRALAQQGVLLGRQQEELAANRQAMSEMSQQLGAITHRLEQLQISPPVVPTAPVPLDAEGIAPRRSEPRLNPPASYSGEPNSCRSFLSQCSLTFSLQPSCFLTERSRVAFVIMHLAGLAREWGTAMWDNKNECCRSYDDFSKELRKVFDRSALGTEAARALSLLQQGTHSVSAYSIEFRTLAASCGWNPKAQWDHFLHGLAEYIKDEIYSLELPTSLDGLIDLAIRVDNRISLRTQTRRVEFPQDIINHTPVTRGAASQHWGLPEEEPMQIGRAHLTIIERRHRLTNNLCLYCGEAGHVAAECPRKRQRPTSKGQRTVSITNTQLPSGGQPILPAFLQLEGVNQEVSALIDSGAEGDFMDIELADRLGIGRSLLTEPIAARTLCGTPLTEITQSTKLVKLTISGNHTEEIRFLLIHSPSAPVVLGHTWLVKHNPHIDWILNSVLAWSPFCLSQCLMSASSPLMSVFTPQEEPVNLANVPEVYHDLRAVFSRSQAASLPPHRPYDCAIELLPGTSPPKGRLYSLSGPEREAMERYINDSLRAGIIRPSSSPAGAGFFFVGKKDGSLRPCIDFRGLNDITVKNSHPLPLMSSAFELLQGATIFSKLDLRNAYHLVRIREGDEWKTAFNTPTGHFEYLVMPFGLSNSPAVFQALVNDVLRDMVDRFVFVYLDDILIFSQNKCDHVQHVRRVLQRLLENRLFAKVEKCEFHARSVPFLGFVLSSKGIRMDPAKVKAVADWPTPENRKAVQRFLGFANFYRRFIRGFSQVALPLTNLTSTRIRFCWSMQAQEAFETLKSRFVSAPILTNPDPSRQFVVEVDASDVGVGAILSQRSPSDDRVHPCAFFSHRLTPSERNYDIGNKELLAVKLALEEWRHWLEGAGVPFIVWTDHKNLEYIRSAKRLNSRQARWALFFSRFDFNISYRPGSKNGKPDALSRVFEVEAGSTSPVTIVPPNRVLAAVTWGVESRVHEALRDVTIPAECPASLLFVPEQTETTSNGTPDGTLSGADVELRRALLDERHKLKVATRWFQCPMEEVKGQRDNCREEKRVRSVQLPPEDDHFLEIQHGERLINAGKGETFTISLETFS
ncbi:retrotransposable element [Pimephales promelas]|nr:retrotransposable element [Pimephales promelas]